MQELERGDSGIRSCVSVQSGLVMYPIYTFGSPEQRDRWIPALASGEAIGCFGLTEPDFGSNPEAMRTTARRDGDEWVLNGSKQWITNGSLADVAVVWARTEEEIRGFLVEKGTPGFTAWDQHGKFSLRTSVTSELGLLDCRIPGDNILPKTVGLKNALMCLNQARYGICLGRAGERHGVLPHGPRVCEGESAVRRPADSLPPAGPGQAGVDDHRDHQGSDADVPGSPASETPASSNTSMSRWPSATTSGWPENALGWRVRSSVPTASSTITR